MAGIHFNTKTGKRGKCTAKPGQCPVCDEQHHFATEEEVNKYEDCLVNPIEDEDALLEASNAEITGTIDHYEKQYKELEEYFEKEKEYNEEVSEFRAETFKELDELRKDYKEQEQKLATSELVNADPVPICEKKSIGYQVNDRFQENYILDDLDVSEKTENELRRLVYMNNVKRLTPEDVSNIKEVADNPELLSQLNRRIKDVQRTQVALLKYNARILEIEARCEALDNYIKTGIKDCYVDKTTSKLFEDVDKKRADLNSKLENLTLTVKYKTLSDRDVKPSYAELGILSQKIKEAKRIRELKSKES